MKPKFRKVIYKIITKYDPIDLAIVFLSLLLFISFFAIHYDFSKSLSTPITISDTLADTNTNTDSTDQADTAEINTDNENPMITATITGAVTKPGTYQLNPASTTNDLINIAGGLLPTANLNTSQINLAATIEDNYTLHIPTADEEEDSTTPAFFEATTIPATQTNSDKININTGTAQQLISLPEIGQKTADLIIEYRTKTPFKTILDLKKVKGIGDKTYDKLKDLITI